MFAVVVNAVSVKMGAPGQKRTCEHCTYIHIVRRSHDLKMTFSTLTKVCRKWGWRGCLTFNCWAHINKVTGKVLKPCGISGGSSYHRSYGQLQPLWRPCFHGCHHIAHAWMLLLSATFSTWFSNEIWPHLLFFVWLLVLFYHSFMPFIRLCVDICHVAFSGLCPLMLLEWFLVMLNIIPPYPSHGCLLWSSRTLWLGILRSVASALWGSNSLPPHYKTLGKVHPEWQQVGHFTQRKDLEKNPTNGKVSEKSKLLYLLK